MYEATTKENAKWSFQVAPQAPEASQIRETVDCEAVVVGAGLGGLTAACRPKEQGVDVVLIESRSHGVMPKISLWRGLGEVVADEETVAIFSSGEPESLPIRQYDLDDIEGAVRLILFLCGRDA
jgi:hypothetical protein